jgi:hypothetical protein
MAPANAAAARLSLNADTLPVPLTLALPNASQVFAQTPSAVSENGEDHDDDKESKIAISSVRGVPQGLSPDVEKAAPIELAPVSAAPRGPPPGMPSFPEGGRDAWFVVAGGWLILFCTWGLINGEFLSMLPV